MSHSRSKMQAYFFFFFFHLQQFLPKDSTSFTTWITTTPPRLFSRLVWDLQYRIIQLNNMLWYLILNSSPDPGSIDDSRFVTCLTIFVDWLSFCPLIYQQTLQGILLPYSPFVLPPAKWTQLWSLKALTEARTLCFRFIYQKVGCQESVSQFNPDVSATCTVCYASMENINHLMIECLFKWSIWKNVFSRYVPCLRFWY
jgi:hypothetical protein